MCYVNPAWLDEAVLAMNSGDEGIASLKEAAELYSLGAMPWSAQVAAICLARGGVSIPDVTASLVKSYQVTGKWYSRLVNWGEALVKPVYGCVAAFERKGRYGVGFVVGACPSDSGRIILLGGFRRDRICLARIRRDDPSLILRYPSKRRFRHELPVYSEELLEGCPTVQCPVDTLHPPTQSPYP